MNHQETLTSYVAAFVSELVKSGVEHVVVSPGSRSTPMAMIMAEHPDLHLYIQVDERSAAFFALGLAKAKKKPVALLCTSGTAAANYYPAIIEAKYARIPLVVLTADRPHELRQIGAPQTIDQLNLYGNHVKWFVEMAPPEASDTMIRYVRTMGARAVAEARRSPEGPVHLNFPFREPLVPNLGQADLFAHSEREAGYVKVYSGKHRLEDQEFERIGKMLGQFRKGLIICGGLDMEGFKESVLQLAKKTQFPILADPLSQLRSGGHDSAYIIETYDTILKNEDAVEALKPDVMIRFGSMPVSKPLSLFMKANHSTPHFIVDGGGEWRDPGLHAEEMIYCDEVSFCEKTVSYIHEKQTSSYVNLWTGLNELAHRHLAKINDAPLLSEGKLFYQLAEQLPEDAALFVGNSMPIRDLDTFFHAPSKRIRVMANRGANGIDGVVSTALGVGAVTQPTYLVLGDLTFFHDLNGLIASKLYNIHMTIIVVNNNGGGIFSFLPQASHPEKFEQLFGTPLHLNFEHAVHMYGGHYELISDWAHFQTALARCEKEPRLSVLEITTNREENVKEHRNLWNFVSQEISRFLKDECQ